MSDYTHIINGKAVTSSMSMTVINPANMQKIAEVPVADKELLDEAVAAARAAFPSWSTKSQEDRAAALLKMASLANAEFELGVCIAALRDTAELRLSDNIIFEDNEAKVIERRVPIGVCAGIIPWNFPLILAMLKLAPAILAGNTFILKPSPFTPLTSLRMIKDMQAFLPPGVVSILSGDDSLGPLITDHPDIDKISFTGSTETGKKVMAGASGKDPAIILPDVDPSKIAPEIFWAAFINNGQTCFAAKRIYIHEEIYDQFRDEFVKYAKTVKTGNGADPGTQLGPVQNTLQYKRVISFIEDSHANNYTFALGGVVPTDPIDGLFIPVSIVDNPPEDSKIVREEPFGPIVPLLKWSNEEEVIRRANDTEYGLSASVWGKDTAAVERIARRIQAGTVCMNEFNPVDRYSAFGGHKKSGLGVENGIHGLWSFTSIQSLTLKKHPVFFRHGNDAPFVRA
ncbi:aldehyde dehydrogenase family [Rhizoctonia solani]|uniref:Aldehyde dehydrogenase family n=1 Tax=Rhizoctonia solani TaxID=456999 RepID=A0A8H7I4P6_9AGAM|nr:aldehyde dehydrogenase family [Rhizoctonia solani]